MKRIGGLIFKTGVKMEEKTTVKHCETCNEDFEVHDGDLTCEVCGDWLE